MVVQGFLPVQNLASGRSGSARAGDVRMWRQTAVTTPCAQPLSGRRKGAMGQSLRTIFAQHRFDAARPPWRRGVAALLLILLATPAAALDPACRTAPSAACVAAAAAGNLQDFFTRAEGIRSAPAGLGYILGATGQVAAAAALRDRALQQSGWIKSALLSVAVGLDAAGDLAAARAFLTESLVVGAAAGAKTEVSWEDLRRRIVIHRVLRGEGARLRADGAELGAPEEVAQWADWVAEAQLGPACPTTAGLSPRTLRGLGQFVFVTDHRAVTAALIDCGAAEEIKSILLPPLLRDAPLAGPAAARLAKGLRSDRYVVALHSNTIDDALQTLDRPWPEPPFPQRPANMETTGYRLGLLAAAQAQIDRQVFFRAAALSHLDPKEIAPVLQGWLLTGLPPESPLPARIAPWIAALDAPDPAALFALLAAPQPALPRAMWRDLIAAAAVRAMQRNEPALLEAALTRLRPSRALAEEMAIHAALPGSDTFCLVGPPFLGDPQDELRRLAAAIAAEQGQPAQAVVQADKISCPAFRAVTLADVALRAAQPDLLATALAAAEALPDPGTRGEALAAIAALLHAKAGQAARDR